MRILFSGILFLAMMSCSNPSEYFSMVETAPFWKASAPVNFEIPVDDVTRPYNLFFDIRYNADYSWSRFFTLYQVKDSVGHSLDSVLLEYYLFDPVTGKPLGSSGIGDLYEKEFLIRKNFKFPFTGKFHVSIRQMMRVDSLEGIRSAGLRMEGTQRQTEPDLNK
jgi:gliding motility-associated lipoprotein GldH